MQTHNYKHLVISFLTLHSDTVMPQIKQKFFDIIGSELIIREVVTYGNLLNQDVIIKFSFEKGLNVETVYSIEVKETDHYKNEYAFIYFVLNKIIKKYNSLIDISELKRNSAINKVKYKR